MSDVKTSLVCLPAFPISITTGLIVLIDRALVTYGYNIRVLTIMNVDGNFSNGDCWGDRLAVAVLVKIHNTGELNGNVVQER
ncbi:MAG: hypothetical protein CM1200mP22_00460 [Dehalococcoidia bacterium]|nr:MAG: hypothetical protein CM1200mP22_00460 [Dehalococcoidia bacterium]